MRKATLIGALIATMLLFGLMLVPIAGASNVDAPALQATATPEATAEATAEATTAPAATAEATAATTAAPTATKAPTTLPTTGGDSGMGPILLGAAALLIMGIAAATLLAGRRGVRS